MYDRCQDGRACPLPHHARGAEHLHGDLLEGEHRRPRLRHDRQEEADTLPQGIEAVNSTTTLLYSTTLPLKLLAITSHSQIIQWSTLSIVEMEIQNRDSTNKKVDFSRIIFFKVLYDKNCNSYAIEMLLRA